MKYNVNFHIIRVLNRFMKGFTQRMGKHIRDHGLTESQFVVMEMLYSKGTLTVSEIIERTLGTDGNIGLVINNLMKQGWVDKQVDSRDRRVRRITLTDEGAEIIGHYFPKHEAFLNEVFANVPQVDKEELIQLLKRIGKQL